MVGNTVYSWFRALVRLEGKQMRALQKKNLYESYVSRVSNGSKSCSITSPGRFELINGSALGGMHFFRVLTAQQTTAVNRVGTLNVWMTCYPPQDLKASLNSWCKCDCTTLKHNAWKWLLRLGPIGELTTRREQRRPLHVKMEQDNTVITFLCRFQDESLVLLHKVLQTITGLYAHGLC